ncbi:hypothetical protein [Bradyrhizobium genosp. P]
MAIVATNTLTFVEPDRDVVKLRLDGRPIMLLPGVAAGLDRDA